MASSLRFAENGRFRILMISDFHGKPDFNPKLTAGIEALVDYGIFSSEVPGNDYASAHCRSLEETDNHEYQCA